MDLDLTDDQALFQETARRFLEAEAPVSRARALIDDPLGYDPPVFRRMAGLGWTAPFVPEASGGGTVSGWPMADLAIVAEEMGRVLATGPVLETNLLCGALARLGTAAPVELLSDLASGRRSATVAHAWGLDDWSAPGLGVTALVSDDGWRLSGTKTLVPYGHCADVLLVTAATGSGVLLAGVSTDAPGLTVERLTSLDLTRPLARVSFEDVPVPWHAGFGDGQDGQAGVEWLLNAGAALQCAETVGAMERCFEITLDYAKSRRAFGRAIGSFQAVKHRLADMALWLESSKAAAVAAIKAVDHGSGTGEPVSVAKAYIGRHGPLLVRSALQIHGGIGYTWEHDVHLYLRRIEANSALWGTAGAHLDRLAELVGFPHREAS